MMVFNKNKIVSDAIMVGEELARARVEKRIKIKDAASELKISSCYLEALENGNFEKLPRGIYGKNFLREYASYLGLGSSGLCAVYDSNLKLKNNKPASDLFSQKVPGAKYFLAMPKMARAALIVMGVMVCLGYIGISMNKIISPPDLAVLSPHDDLLTSEHSVDIRGVTEPEAEIMVNDELVVKNTDGYFEKKVDLKSGLNVISITAQKKYSRKNNIVKKILVKS